VEERLLNLDKKLDIIVAHPDDEIIFFWFALKHAKRIICCTNDLNINFPKSKFWEKSWIHRQTAFEEIGKLLGIEVINLGYNSGFVSLPKEEITKLSNKIYDLIKDEETVITHNAWGEYGHPDHILVHNIIKESGKTLLVSDIMLEGKGLIKFTPYPKPEIKDFLEVTNTDLNFYEKCKEIYTKYNVWTWYQKPILKTKCYLEKENEKTVAIKNKIITLKNDKLSVDFDLQQGGMPIKDNFGYIRRYGIEIGWIGYPHPYKIINPQNGKTDDLLLQATQEKTPAIIKQTETEFATTGQMKRFNVYSPHVFKLNASLEGNRLHTSVELDIKARETCLQSKVWIMLNFFEKAKIGDKIIDFTDLPYDTKSKLGEEWLGHYGAEWKKNPPKEIILFNDTKQLKIDGFSVPPIFFSLIRFKNQIIEVVFGWSELDLLVGTYKGEMNLTYEK
jgi:hypothetical protein